MIASRRLLDLAGIQYRYRKVPVSRLLLRVIFRIICLIENAKSWMSDIKSSALWCMQVTAQLQQTWALNEHWHILLWEHLKTQSRNPDVCFFLHFFFNRLSKFKACILYFWCLAGSLSPRGPRSWLILTPSTHLENWTTLQSKRTWTFGLIGCESETGVSEFHLKFFIKCGRRSVKLLF